MRTATTGVLVVVALGGVAAGVAGQPAAYVWGALALLGLAGHLYAGRLRRNGSANGLGLRVYSISFAAALVAAAVLFSVLAVTGGADHRGAYIGLVILWSVMATAAVLLVIALERRRRALGSKSRGSLPGTAADCHTGASGAVPQGDGGAG